ncbi:MAG TPA: hypothetical protein VKU41_00335 [Polyangiaceae bacterium]|nr:hypothetical protein [Polyangiaceae bacterium]
MRVISALATVAAAGVTIVVSGRALTACSSSTTTPGNSSGNGACTNALTVYFNPMYTAYIPNSMHTFQLPALVNATDHVQWSATDSTGAKTTAIQWQDNPDLTIAGWSAITITVTSMPPSPITLTAQSGNLCGSGELTITQASENDWQIGNARYNNGSSLHVPMFNFEAGAGGGPPMFSPDAGSIFETSDGGPACTNCHGPTATDNMFKDISHTPEQTAGFSDQDLLNIILNASVPDGGYFDPNIVSYMGWQFFHKWTDITPDQQKGIVVYLRSLTPVAQMGSADIGAFARMQRGMGGSGSSDAGATE